MLSAPLEGGPKAVHTVIARPEWGAPKIHKRINRSGRLVRDFRKFKASSLLTLTIAAQSFARKSQRTIRISVNAQLEPAKVSPLPITL